MMPCKPAALFTAMLQSATLALLVTVSGCSSKLDSNKFLGKAIQDGMAEIQGSHLAQEKSSDPDVKKFAVRMIDEHSKIDAEIVELAKTSGATLPQGITADQKLKFDEMSKLAGHEFDKRFTQHNVEEHEHAVKDYSEQAEKGSDVAVKAFASRTLPILKEHLQMAKGVNTKVQP
jgi:putative membrane protein